jgi:hypothetical protein
MPLGRRTGLFLLVLRPVEFSANPIVAYPTTIAGPRRIEDGDVIEATAITLIPYPDSGGAATLAEARRYVARKLFLGEAAGLPQDALPLGMLAMERGSVRWVDVAMVRRETGADTPLAVSMGARPRWPRPSCCSITGTWPTCWPTVRGAGSLPLSPPRSISPPCPPPARCPPPRSFRTRWASSSCGSPPRCT